MKLENIQKGFEVAVSAITSSIAHIVRYTGYRIILMLGRMAEIILLFTTSFLMIDVYAHSYLSGIIGNATVENLHALSILSIVTLPEIVFFTAFKAAKDSIQEAKQKGDIDSIIYAVGFSASTIAFLVMWGNAIYIAGTVAELSNYKIDSFWLVFRMSSVVIYVVSSFLYQLENKKEITIAVPIDVEKENLNQGKKVEIVESGKATLLVESKEILQMESPKTERTTGKLESIEVESGKEEIPEMESIQEEVESGNSNIIELEKRKREIPALDLILERKQNDELDLLISRNGKEEREKLSGNFQCHEKTVKNKAKAILEKRA